MSTMKEFRARAKRVLKAAGIAMRNLPLTLAGLFVLTCVELFTAGGILESTTGQFTLFGAIISMAALEIGVSYGCGVLSFIGSGVVAELRADPRPEHRRRASSARAASTALLLVPIVFFTNALALPIQRHLREEYLASERYQMHRAAALGQCLELMQGERCYVDPLERARAQAELRQADEVRTARIDGTWFMALMASVFVYGTLAWAGTALHRPRPETPWEAKERAAAAKRYRQRLAREEKRRQEERAARSTNRAWGRMLGTA